MFPWIARYISCIQTGMPFPNASFCAGVSDLQLNNVNDPKITMHAIAI